jgi:putative flavoprotein involved in K+ transport
MIILQASVLNNGEIMKRFKTVIIGGGQAGLSLSYLLQKLSHDHIVLDKAEQVADTWRNHRWDSFALVTPNWTFQMPGVEYHEECQDDYMPRDEIVKRLEKYVEQYALPVQHNTTVTAVAPDESLQKGYLIHTSNETYHVDNVVVATGLFQKAKTLPLSVELPPSILQLTSGQYRSPDALPPGAVLVVGSAQSGCQIVEDLLLDGRKVYLCVSKAGRAPRRYRGLDLFHWLRDTGFMDRTPDLLETPRQRFNPNPQVTGARGGHDINLHQFYRDGVVLLGRLLAYQDGKLLLSPDLHENLLRADRAEGELIKMIDRFIENNGIDAEQEERLALSDGFSAPQPLSIDLAETGISTIIWACGYTFDFSMVRLPVTDEYGFPITNRGATQHPGLYFLGMPWISKAKSGLFMGIAEDAAYIADRIVL